MSYASMPSFSFILFTEKKNFEYSFENLPFTTKQIKQFEQKSYGGLLNKHFFKKIQISPMTWQKFSISTFPIISLWEL